MSHSQYWKLSATAVEYGPKQWVGSRYWKQTRNMARGFLEILRLRISQDWGGLPGNIDAAFTYQDNSATYFFKVPASSGCGVTQHFRATSIGSSKTKGNRWDNFQLLMRSPPPLSPATRRTSRRASPGYLPTSTPRSSVQPTTWSTSSRWPPPAPSSLQGNEYWRFEPKNRPHIQKNRYPKVPQPLPSIPPPSRSRRSGAACRHTSAPPSSGTTARTTSSRTDSTTDSARRECTVSNFVQGQKVYLYNEKMLKNMIKYWKMQNKLAETVISRQGVPSGAAPAVALPQEHRHLVVRLWRLGVIWSGTRNYANQ